MWPETYDFRYHEIVKRWVILPTKNAHSIPHTKYINKDITSPSELTFDLKVIGEPSLLHKLVRLSSFKILSSGILFVLRYY